MNEENNRCGGWRFSGPRDEPATLEPMGPGEWAYIKVQRGRLMVSQSFSRCRVAKAALVAGELVWREHVFSDGQREELLVAHGSKASGMFEATVEEAPSEFAEMLESMGCVNLGTFEVEDLEPDGGGRN